MNEQQKDQKTILLVEDEAMIAIMQKETLKKHRYNVIIAHSGENGIEVVRTTPYIDLILMDINLGKGRMDGIEAAEIILRDKEIPILFLSSYTQAEVVENTERITSYGYVVKDSGETVLLASIKMAFKLDDAHRKLKKREDELQESEEKYRNIFDNAIEGIFRTTIDGCFTGANSATARMLGYESPEELFSTITDMRSQFYAYPEDRDKFIGLLKKEGFLKNFEVQCRHKNGNIIWGILNVQLARDDQGNILYIEGMCQDITERKQAEEKLKQHTSAIEASMDGMAILNEDQQYVYMNKAHAEIYGYNMPKELIGKTWRVLYDEDELQRFDRDIMPELSQKGRWRGEARGKKKDGSPFHQEISLTAMDNNWLICVVRDITDRKKTEDKIQKLFAEKELLIREVHHRIKNNMTVIMSLLSLQSSMLKDPSAISSLEDARNRIRTMMILYDKLYRSTDFREISTKAYLASLMDEIVANFPNRGSVAIETHIDDFALDAKTLSPVGMILNELLTNAMKHAFPEEMFNVQSSTFKINKPAKITVTLTEKQDSEPRTLNVEHRTLAQQVTLSKQFTLIVQDNGVGIPESIDIATTTGFGLQLADILTQQLEGAIRIERQNGSRFILSFDISGIE
jgi:PAS domain S-box-containing protein